MTDLAAQIGQFAADAGFARAAFASAKMILPAARYEDWLARGCHADMSYLVKNLPQRFHPDVLVPGSVTVICLAASYAPAPKSPSSPVARYARGRDYHKVLKKRCLAIMDRIRELVPGFEGRAFVDSAPIMERSLAAASGLGWIGRNGCLIVPGLGSYVVLAEIVCNLQDLPPGEPIANGCGDCHACVAACPTGALFGDGLADARKCVSYLTLEHAGPIPRDRWEQMGVRLCGCDACQEACPHNRNLPAGDAELASTAPLGGASLLDILGWDETQWDAATRGSACRRADFAMLLRNAAIASGNSAATGEQAKQLRAALTELARRRNDLADVIEWALEKLSCVSRGC